MKKKFVTLSTVRFGDWLVKASLIDDQILVVGQRVDGLVSFIKMFYDERKAHSFIESLNKKTVKPVE